MAKALKIGASIAAIAAVTVVTGGAALGLGVSLGTSIIGTGISAGTLLAASSVLGAGASLLAPKPKAPAGLSQSDRLTVSIGVREPRKIVFGSTAMATDLRDQEWSNDQTYLHRFIVLASHKVSAVREIWFDDKLAWTAAGGAQGEFAKWLVVTPVPEGNAANAINIGPRMGGSRRFTGCAYVHLRYQILANSKKLDSVFNQKVPERVTIVGDGAAVYDPRRDSTVPGGSGPQRANDQSTWEWNASASRNPALCTLFYLLGWRINGKLADGKGIPPRRIDLASFIEAANLCDEPVAKSAGGTEPRYRCDGVISEADDTTAVLDNLKATMNAVLDDVDGRLRISVLHNDLAAPIGDLFTGDVLGAANWQQTLPLNDSVSVIRGGYTDPGSVSLYQTADYPEVTIASRDGIERSQTVNYPLVQSASQAQRLSKQRLQRMLYGGTFTAVFQSTAWKFQKGDVIRLTFAPLGWNRKLFRIADMATQVDGKVPMMLREENPAIYAWDASDAAPVTGAEPTRYDASLWPLLQGIAEAGTTADWDKVADPGNTKPADNATNSADPNSPFGPNGTVGGIQAAIDAATEQQEKFANETIPAVDKAVADATKLIDDAAKSLTDMAERVTVVESSSANSGNLLTNTDCAVDASGWTFVSESDSRGYLAAFGPDAYWPVGTKPLQIYSPNGSASRAGYWYQDVRGIEGGGSYQASIYVGSHRTTAGLYLIALRADGSIIRAWDKYSGKFNTGTRNLKDDYERLVLNIEVPADTATLSFLIMKNGTLQDAGYTDSYSWFLRPQLAKIRKGVTEAVPYTPGSADAAQAALSAKVSVVEKAGNDGRLALASRVSSVEAAAGAAQSSVNPNPDFSAWKDPATLPDRWVFWNVVDPVVQIANPLGRGGFAVKQSPTTDPNTGFFNPDVYVAPGRYFMEVTAYKVSGSWRGAGLTLSGEVGIHFGSTPDITGASGDTGDIVRSWSIPIEVEAGTGLQPGFKNWHCMTNWTGYGEGLVAKELWWLVSRLRPASGAEADLPAVAARVRQTENALVDLPNNYATAQRAATLEAQVNMAADSGLKRALSAQIEERATVIADQKSGVVAQSVAQLRTDFDGRIGQVEQKAGVIDGLNQRTSVFWQVGLTTPDGYTSINLTKTDGTPALFYVGANMLIRGDLIVDGAVTLRTLNRGTMTATTQASRTGTFDAPYNGGVTPVPGIAGEMPVGEGGSLYFTVSASQVTATNGADTAAYPSVQLLDTSDNVLGDYKLPLAAAQQGGLANYVVRALNIWGARAIRWRLVNRGAERSITIINNPAASLYWTAL